MECPMARVTGAYLRLCFPEFPGWSGRILVTGLSDGAHCPLPETTPSDPSFENSPQLAVTIETSDDGSDWTTAGADGPDEPGDPVPGEGG
jgi:hypothetical protein